jgi:hypothetical protein
MKRSTNELIKEGHLASRRGEKAEARQLLEQAAQQDPQDFRVWLGLAAVSKTPQASMAMIDKAAAIQPDHAAVIQARKWAKGLVKSSNGSSITEAVTVPYRQPPPAKTIPSINMPVPVEESGQNRGYLFRRVVGAAAILGVIFALAILTWYGWTTLLNNSNGMEKAAVESDENSTLGGIALLPEVELPNLLAEEEPDAAAVQDATATPNPIQPKDIIQEAGEPRPRWTSTPLPTITPTPSPTWVPTFVSPISEEGILKPLGLLPTERWIDVDISTQSLVAYEGDKSVFQTLISSGLSNYPTVLGTFRIWLRYESQTMDGSRLGYDYYLENVPFVQYFYEDYALHGTYWHSNFGTPMSHGCVNLSNTDSEWLYNFADYGTVVNVHD